MKRFSHDVAHMQAKIMQQYALLLSEKGESEIFYKN